ncbi:MAG: hypothetical protein JOZ23_01805 [Mycobacterium sp.]|nr:hypothetical protein [Mycobacterium sp.]MBV9350260.1 hypothetical protein [Mycobacterium sp.]
MRSLVSRLAASVVLAVAPMAAVTIATPPVSSAQPLDCDPGQWWDPTANVCRPLGVGPQPLDCEPGQWWDPTANVCRPVVPPGD